MKINRFEDLEIWQLALKITNIVEGFEKNNNNEFKRFLEIAKGSYTEVRNQLFIALTVGYISKQEFDYGNKLLLDELSKIGKFISYLKEIKSKGLFTKK